MMDTRSRGHTLACPTLDRAMTKGWRRGLLEYYGFAWYSNALAQQAAARAVRNLHGAAWVTQRR